MSVLYIVEVLMMYSYGERISSVGSGVVVL